MKIFSSYTVFLVSAVVSSNIDLVGGKASFDGRRRHRRLTEIRFDVKESESSAETETPSLLQKALEPVKDLISKVRELHCVHQKSPSPTAAPTSEGNINEPTASPVPPTASPTITAAPTTTKSPTTAPTTAKPTLTASPTLTIAPVSPTYAPTTPTLSPTTTTSPTLTALPTSEPTEEGNTGNEPTSAPTVDGNIGPNASSNISTGAVIGIALGGVVMAGVGLYASKRKVGAGASAVPDGAFSTVTPDMAMMPNGTEGMDGVGGEVTGAPIVPEEGDGSFDALFDEIETGVTPNTLNL